MVLHHDLEIVSTKAGHLAKFLYEESTSNETVSSAFGLVFEGLLSGNWLKRLLVRLFTFNFLELACKLESRNINKLRYADDSTLMAEREEELKSLLMKVKEESEKAVLKLNIQKTKIMASSPITSWQIDVETLEQVADFILGGSKITADGDCSHEIKR